MRNNFTLIFLFFLSIISNSCNEKSKHFIYDDAHILSQNEMQILDSILIKHEIKTSNDIILMTIKDIYPEDNLYAYSRKLFDKVKPGKKHKNNGVLIVVCTGCKGLEIITGIGTEKILKDDKAQHIINKSMISNFKNGNFYQGIHNGIVDITSFLEMPGNEIK